MRVYTVHVRAGDAPVLVREAFSWGALLFGPFWLLAHRAWVAALAVLVVDVLVAAVPVPAVAVLGSLALAWASGLFGHDLRRLTLEARDFALVHVVAAPDADAALAQLLARRPDLTARALA